MDILNYNDLLNFNIMSRLSYYGILLLLANTLVCPIPTNQGISLFSWYNFDMPLFGPEIFGANPATIKWNIVRGDTSPLRVEFLEDDEISYFDTTDWTYKATAYDPKSDYLDELEVIPGEGYVDIIAPASITELWGSGYRSIVAELTFDLQVTIDEETVWTPIIGVINVLGDVSGSL